MGFGGRQEIVPDARRCGNVGFTKGSVQFLSGANAGFPPPAVADERSGIESPFDVICMEGG